MATQKDIKEILTEAYNQGYNNAVYNILNGGLFSTLFASVVISFLLDMLYFFLVSRLNPYTNLTSNGLCRHFLSLYFYFILFELKCLQ